MDCKSCKYCRRLKKDFKVGKGYAESECCILFADEADGFVLEVGDNSYCEMYMEAENEQGN